MKEYTIEETIVDALNEALTLLDSMRSLANGTPAGREFSLAITALEDAQMRFERGLTKSYQPGL